MCSLASDPAVPGVATECERPFVVEEAVSAPAIASALQASTTRRRWASANRVSFPMPAKLDAAHAAVIGLQEAIRLLREQ
jgi:hypothetical protein